MGIIGERPESGLRLDLERPRDGGPPWAYAGEVVTPEARFVARAVIVADGAVSVELVDAPAALDLEGRVKLILRAAYKHAQPEPPPRRIQRWRGDKLHE